MKPSLGRLASSGPSRGHQSSANRSASFKFVTLQLAGKQKAKPRIDLQDFWYCKRPSVAPGTSLRNSIDILEAKQLPLLRPKNCNAANRFPSVSGGAQPASSGCSAEGRGWWQRRGACCMRFAAQCLPRRPPLGQHRCQQHYGMHTVTSHDR